MRLSLTSICDFITRFGAVIIRGFPATLEAVSSNPGIIFRPISLARIFLTHVFLVEAEPLDSPSNSKDLRDKLITPNAFGVVLDIGAGHGHTASYLDRSLVTTYIALEPYTDMHHHIRKHANEAGFHESDASLIILSHGAEDTKSILLSLNNSLPKDTSPKSTLKFEQPVDTIISIRALCSVPSPQKTIKNLVRDILRPGGGFLMYEHVLSELEDVAWWQRFWAPVWTQVFDGCRIDRPSDVWIAENMSEEGTSTWREGATWRHEGDQAESVNNLFCHRAGKFVKA